MKYINTYNTLLEANSGTNYSPNVTKINNQIIYTNVGSDSEIMFKLLDTVIKGIAVVAEQAGVKYSSLNDAIINASDNDTVVLLADTSENIVVGKHIKLDGNSYSINSLYITKDGLIELIGDITVINDFGLEAAIDSGGQFMLTNAQITVSGQAYVDKKFDNIKRDSWYTLSVPFPVRMNTIKNADDLTAALNYGSDYIFLGFDGAARANNGSGWIRYNTPGILEPGKLYMIGTDGSMVHRFYKIIDEDLITTNNPIPIYKYESTNESNANWNGIGNSLLYNVIVSVNNGYKTANLYENNNYIPINLNDTPLRITTGVFVQGLSESIATLTPVLNTPSSTIAN